jgi:hexosaminidase
MRRIVLVTAFFLPGLFGHTQSGVAAIIPKPVAVSYTEGTLVLKEKCTVSSNFPASDWKVLLPYFKREMKDRYQISLTEVTPGKPADIFFDMRRMPSSGKPAYRIKVDEKRIVVSSNFSAPAFHAMQTLFQLMPPGGGREIPLLEIYDYPRFEYRGMHLDVSRHFFPVSFIRKYIDYLAYYKFNRFHWHLTDDQGWRIEIKKFPELTRTGAWRNGTITGKYPGSSNDNKRYGGFYSKEEIKEVVKYAAERFIEVIPEIEMPGHSSAAIAAYPWLSCFPGKATTIPGGMASRESAKEQENGRVKLVQ